MVLLANPQPSLAANGSWEPVPSRSAPRLPAGESRPELELLLRCASTHRGASADADIAAWCHPELDWRALCKTANEHALLPLLFKSLEAAGAERVPEKVFTHLRNAYHTSIARSMLLTGELLRILELLRSAGIEGVPFKGPVLGQTAYGSVELRPCGDLDVLVKREDALTARALLSRNGFEAFPKVTPAQERAFMRSECEFWFGEARDLVSLEVHWAIREPAYAFPFDTERMWKRLDQVSFGGKVVHSLRAEDMLLVLAGHGAKHRWVSLKLVGDLAALVRANPDLDWDDVLRQAKTLHAERVLRLGLVLAAELLNAPLPAVVRHWIEGDRAVPALVAETRRRMFASSADRAATERSLGLYLRTRERLRDRIRYFFGTLLTPTLEDWNWVALPEVLYPLYYVLRPARLASKYWKLHRGASGN